MMTDHLSKRAAAHLHKLCIDIPQRPVGSPGNREATAFFAETIAGFGFQVDTPEFDCIDWRYGGASLTVGDEPFEVLGSPYGLGCDVRGPLAVVSTVDELAAVDAAGKVLLVRGALSREQLMPKNFTFFNPDHHKRIVGLLEAKAPLAIVAATSRNPELAGGLYPFPLIEDGDFGIPSAYMTEEEGARLTSHTGKPASLFIDAERIPAKGYNVVARKGGDPHRRIVVFAHIDAKMDSPGAIDNATGAGVLLLLAELLGSYTGDLTVEIVAANGEDYYSAPGQVLYVRANAGRFEEIALAINLDGAGYREGATAYSLYGCADAIAASVRRAFAAQPGMIEGEPWYQSDHSIFIQQGRPAMAITSERLMELSAQFTHTPKDHPRIVDPQKLAHIAQALHDLIVGLAA